METKLVIFITILAFGLGVLAYPLIFGTSTEPIVPDILIARAKPDTVTVDKYIVKEIPKIVTRIVRDTIFQTKTNVIVDTVYIASEVPYFKSYKKFEFDYVNSQIWAWAETPVDSFKNELEINWQKYFIEKQKPVLTSAKYNYFVIGSAVGLSAGILATMLLIK